MLLITPQIENLLYALTKVEAEVFSARFDETIGKVGQALNFKTENEMQKCIALEKLDDELCGNVYKKYTKPFNFFLVSIRNIYYLMIRYQNNCYILA
jgi:hypothetical protein